MDATANGNHHADPEPDDFGAAIDAFDTAGYEPTEDDVVFGFDPQVLYDDESGEVRLAVTLPVEGGGEQPVHIPLDDGAMVSIVNGLAEARGMNVRVPSPSVSSNQAAEHDQAAADPATSSGWKRMVDPAGLRGLTPDYLPDTILGVPKARMLTFILVGVLVISFLLMLLL